MRRLCIAYYPMEAVSTYYLMPSRTLVIHALLNLKFSNCLPTGVLVEHDLWIVREVINGPNQIISCH